MSSKWDKFDQIERDQKRLKTELQKLKESKAVYGEVLSNTDDELEVWDRLREDLEDGNTIYAPSDKPKKRKRSGGSGKSRKKRSKRDSGSDIETSDDDITDESDAEPASSPQGEPLQLEVIEERIADLKAKKKEARLRRRELDSQINTVKDELKALDGSHNDIEAEMSAICISGRNQYSKGAIQQDVGPPTLCRRITF
jgi:chromosome segregation ATPase